MDAEEVFKVLSHPLRLEVLRTLSADDGTRYTDVLEGLGVETGKLNFHLRKLDGFVESRDDGYVLTRRGVEALRVAEAAETAASAPATVPVGTGSVEPRARLRALALDAALFVLAPMAASLFAMLAVPVQLSLDRPLLYVAAGLNVGEHLLAGSILLLSALALGEGLWGRTPGKSLSGLRVTRDGAPPGVPVSLLRAVATVYLLPLDFLAARALGLRELRATDRFLGVAVIRDDEPRRSGGGGGEKGESWTERLADRLTTYSSAG